MWIKGWIPYEECYRVPMIVRWPGHIAGGQQDIASGPDARSRRIRMLRRREPRNSAVRRRTQALQPLFEDPGAYRLGDEILCAYYGGEFLYTQRIAITNRFKYVFNGFDYRRAVRSDE